MKSKTIKSIYLIGATLAMLFALNSWVGKASRQSKPFPYQAVEEWMSGEAFGSSLEDTDNFFASSQNSSQDILENRNETILNSDPIALSYLAEAFLKEGKSELAIDAYRQASASQDSNSTYRMGEIFENKHPASASRDAALWFSLSARSNFKDAAARADGHLQGMNEADLNWIREQTLIQEKAELKWKRDTIARLELKMRDN